MHFWYELLFLVSKDLLPYQLWRTPYLCSQEPYNLILHSLNSRWLVPYTVLWRCSFCQSDGGSQVPWGTAPWTCRSASCVPWGSWSHPSKGNRDIESRHNHLLALCSHCHQYRPWMVTSWWIFWFGSDFSDSRNVLRPGDQQRQLT